MLRQRGDTLIEVLFAVSIFSLVAVSALSIMNQGTAISERALETTLVRQEIDAQASTLRFLHDSYIAAYQPDQVYDSNKTPQTPAEQWQAMEATIIANGITSTSDFTNLSAGCPTSPPNGSFIMDARNAKFINVTSKIVPATTYAQVTYDTVGANQVIKEAQGVWVEAVRSATNTGDSSYQSHIGYIDFHIRACWLAPGQSIPVTIGTIVRLYGPR